MASNINTTDIDAEYPVAGQDNDSQGFRDNFSTIKDNFVAAKQEIESLQSSTAQGVTYTSNTSTNDFNYNKITNSILVANVEETYNAGATGSEETISILYSNGSYQTFQVSAEALSVSFEWPNFSSIPGGGALCKIRLVISGNGTESTVTFGGTTVRKNYSGTMTVESTTRPRVVDVWTDDGAVIYVQDHGEFF